MDIPKNKPRARRYKESTPIQKALNDKQAKKRFIQIMECNIRAKDYFVTLTYDPKHEPADISASEKNLRNYFRRLKNKTKSKDGKLIYIAVTEESSKGHIHHHVAIKSSCKLSRDEIEEAWHVKNQSLGLVNCISIKETEAKNVSTLAGYMTKNMKGTRRWMSSRNLKKPEVFISDSAISRRQYREISLFNENCVSIRERFNKQYPGYMVTDYENYFNPDNGQNYIRVKLRKRQI